MQNTDFIFCWTLSAYVTFPTRSWIACLVKVVFLVVSFATSLLFSSLVFWQTTVLRYASLSRKQPTQKSRVCEPLEPHHLDSRWKFKLVSILISCFDLDLNDHNSNCNKSLASCYTQTATFCYKIVFVIAGHMWPESSLNCRHGMASWHFFRKLHILHEFLTRPAPPPSPREKQVICLRCLEQKYPPNAGLMVVYYGRTLKKSS